VRATKPKLKPESDDESDDFAGLLQTIRPRKPIGGKVALQSKDRRLVWMIAG
jgi:hypothetical protein